MTISNPELRRGTYSIYKGGTIEGESTNGLYSNITSYSKGEKINVTVYAKEDEYRGRGPSGGMMMPNNMNNNKLNVGLVVILGIVAVLCLGIALVFIKKETGRIANLFLGIIVGGAIVAIIFMFLNNARMNNQFDMLRGDRNWNDFSCERPSMNQNQRF